MARIPITRLPNRTVQHGVNDDDFPHRLSTSQVSKSVNMSMTKDGVLETRGGSIKLSDTATGAADDVDYIHEFFERETDGTITRTLIIKANTTVYKFNTATAAFDSVQTGLSANKPSMVNFIDNSGAEVMFYADGENFAKYDGTTWTSVLANFQAGGGTDCPRYLGVGHTFLFAAGDDSNPDKLFYSPALAPDTNWGANDYLTLEGGFDKITGINELYDYVVASTINSIYIVTGKTGATFALIRVAAEVGATSHWSLVTDGTFLYWFHNKRPYIGKLRAAEDDGMEVEYIGGNLENTLNDVTDGFWDEIQGVWHEDNGQIYWTYKTSPATNPDRLLVYSTIRSTPNEVKPKFGLDLRYVWAGYFDSLNFNSIGKHHDSNGVEKIYVGTAVGTVLEMFSGYKDSRAVGATTGTDITYEIRSREETLSGSVDETMRVRRLLPTMYQKYNGAWTFQYIKNRSVLLPASARSITFTGNIPYWHDGSNARITSKWNSTVWAKKPTLTGRINVGVQANSILFIFKMSGSNRRQEGSLVSYTTHVQRLPSTRRKAAA